MGLLNSRLTFFPFEYQKAEEYWLKQQQNYWLHTSINLSSDVTDWKSNLTESEKSVIGGVLKGFTTMEILVGCYWTNVVAKNFKKPEIQMMASAFSSFEGIHARSYSLLNETLGLNDFDAFLYEPSAKARIDSLIEVKGKSRKDIARSLAIFSAFTEGVTLFSSFAILLNFSRFNKLKGVGQIIAYSIKDESLHAEAGTWLFRQFVEEYPEVMTDDLKKDIYDAARLTVQLEDDFIDKVFEKGDIEGITVKDLKAFIRFRTNTKLVDLGLKQNWKNIDKEAVSNITSWFDVLSSGITKQDFFAGKEVNYSHNTVDWSKTFE